MECPRSVWLQLMNRDDGQICSLELLAVLLLVATLPEEVKGKALTVYIENEGVRSSIVSASCKAADHNLVIGKLWELLAVLRSCVDWRRVESKANIADLPSREDEIGWSGRFNATRREPRLPDFLRQIWAY